MMVILLTKANNSLPSWVDDKAGVHEMQHGVCSVLRTIKQGKEEQTPSSKSFMSSNI